MDRIPRRGRRSARLSTVGRPLLLAPLLLGLVGLAGCGSADQLGSHGVDQHPASPTSSASPTRLSAQDYQQQLATTNASLSAAWQAVASAGPYDALGSALADASTSATQAADQLAALAPPTGADETNTALVAGLRQLATDLSGLNGQVSSSQLCANPSVVSNLSTATGTAQLRDAAARLRDGGFQWGDFLGAPVPLPDYRLANGDVINDHRRGGMGQLTVDNGTDSDAVLTLTQGGSPVVSLYVGHGDKATLTRITDGTYQVFFTTGVDWSVQDRLFTRSCAFSQFDESASYSTIQESGEVRYKAYHLTLQPVLNGNATTSSVPARNFPR
jgi:hypothetical protein